MVGCTSGFEGPLAVIGLQSSRRSQVRTHFERLVPDSEIQQWQADLEDERRRAKVATKTQGKSNTGSRRRAQNQPGPRHTQDTSPAAAAAPPTAKSSDAEGRAQDASPATAPAVVEEVLPAALTDAGTDSAKAAAVAPSPAPAPPPPPAPTVARFRAADRRTNPRFKSTTRFLRTDACCPDRCGEDQCQETRRRGKRSNAEVDENPPELLPASESERGDPQTGSEAEDSNSDDEERSLC